MPEPQEAQQPSLIETMEAAYNELSTDEETATEVETPQATIPDPDAADEAAPVEAGAEDGKPTTDDQAEDTETGDDQPLTAPEHWSDDDKQVFSALDANGQEFLLRRHREMEADYTRKTQDIAEQRKTLEPLDKVLAPHRATWQQFGLDDATAISRLIATEQQIRANPVQGIQTLARAYGVNLGQLVPDDTDQSDYQDPATAALQQRIDQLENMLSQQSTTQFAAQQSAIQTQIDTFRNAVDDKGQPAHPHFAAVETRMAALIAAERQLGRQLSLDDAYSQAVQLDPAIKSQVEAERRKAEEAELERKAAERAKKAKRAAKANVSSSGASSGGKPAGTGNVKDDLKRTAAELGY